MQQGVSTPPIYVDLQTTAALTTLATSSIQAMAARGEFPRPRMLSGRRVAWLYREVMDWAEQCPPSDLPPPPNTGAKKPRKSSADQEA